MHYLCSPYIYHKQISGAIEKLMHGVQMTAERDNGKNVVKMVRGDWGEPANEKKRKLITTQAWIKEIQHPDI